MENSEKRCKTPKRLTENVQRLAGPDVFSHIFGAKNRGAGVRARTAAAAACARTS